MLYFSLHGLPEQPFWYGPDHLTAMSVDAFQGLDLSQTVVFVANCHLAQTPFLAAILECHPLLLVAGRGTNYTRGRSLVGTHLLGYLFRLAISLCIPAPAALALAKYTLTLRTDALDAEVTRLKLRPAKQRLTEDIAANLDALEFEAYT
ncbi:MAG: hypothetical protein MUQ65_12110 [Armatimonadetes bacterium]|nr:hypothetical protein [Armatimonadota bacterium]